jgi:uncharacterized protein YigA (DUF484 family)
MAAEIPRQEPETGVDDAQVRDYLTRHPEFFQRHPDMLRTLHIPHATGEAVSLVERQVSVLRERNVDLRHRLRELTDAAQENERLYFNTRKLVLALLEAGDLQALFSAFADGMRRDFATDHAALIVYGDGPAHPEGRCRHAPREDVQARIGGLLRGSGPACGALRGEEFAYLFPGTAAREGSAAMVPLHHERELGLVAVGSADAGRYHARMGTLFLEHLADVIARLLPRTSDGAQVAS